MKHNEVKAYRLRLITWLKGILALGATGLLAFAGVLTFKKPIKKTTHRLLTQDGLLVEIDSKAVIKSKHKINPTEIHHWIK
jgi:hypothetical protein